MNNQTNSTEEEKPPSDPPTGQICGAASCSAAVVSAELSIRIEVECPHCEEYIDLLDPSDTDGVYHNDESQLMNQAFPSRQNWTDAHHKFSCDDVTCSECKKTFKVQGLEW